MSLRLVRDALIVRTWDYPNAEDDNNVCDITLVCVVGCGSLASQAEDLQPELTWAESEGSWDADEANNFGWR